jgi:hypothetical protein
MEQPVTEESSHNESIRIAHLTMLQGVIARMGANSFTLKALSATFGSAAIAVMATAAKPSPYYPVAAVIPIIIFWLMDAQYLRYERGYRKLFERVRRGEDVDSYSLDASPFMGDVGPILKLAVSWSVAWFYIAILISLVAIAVMIFVGGLNGDVPINGSSSEAPKEEGVLLIPLSGRYLAR